jgi:predicted GNAT family acetyltransferase
MDHPITHVLDSHKGAFVIDHDGTRLATMTYTLAGDDTIILDHTDVDASLRGSGAGQALVAAAVAWARDSARKILPLCPFARSVFERTPEYADTRS